MEGYNDYEDYIHEQEIQEDNTLYDYSNLAYHLLVNDTNMDHLSNQILAMDADSTMKNSHEQETFKFELLVNIAMEIIFQYLHMASITSMLDEDGGLKEDDNIDQSSFTQNIDDYSADDIEELLKHRMLKICVLPLMSETDEDDKGYYCRTIFKDSCTPAEKHNYFDNNPNVSEDTKFHFVLGSNFDPSSVEKLEDVYTVFKVKDKIHKLKFYISTPISANHHLSSPGMM